MTLINFNFDALSVLTAFLITFICLIVFSYSKTYLNGDKKRSAFLAKILLINITLIVTFSSDNIFVMSAAWIISNVLLVLMMIHKKSWQQSLDSGIIALKNFIFGFICLSLALYILFQQSGTYLISEIILSEEISQKSLIISCCLILLAALSQSAIYPFHSWLLSSLNSPTPASAIMHAGLVNGGGILLARFAPLFFKVPDILTAAFILGISSAMIGTLWKLIQSNVKGMLACSTMSQMGFMIAQCAMGLFPAAIAHLFWHGMFKSYLFLSSAGSWQERRLDFRYPPQLISFVLALICGTIGALIFARINSININDDQTTLILVEICFIAATQVALTIIDRSPLKKFVPAFVLSSAVSAIYASSVVFIEKLMPPEIFYPQELNFWHLAAGTLLMIMWIVRLFWPSSQKISPLFLKLYVRALNASQPLSKTITSNRNQYNFK
jgi:NAD(P)H-quinone oxidoreductase subunit 5